MATNNRAPTYHHPKSQGVVQRSLRTLDEPVTARVGGVDVRLAAGTTVVVTGGGIGPTGRMSWHGRLMDGREMSIAVE